MNDIDRIARDAIYPGNLTALVDLLDGVAQRSVTAFTGAGVSIPLAPTWSSLLGTFLENGIREGFIDPQDEKVLRPQVLEDPLELASTLEELYTKARFRSRLASTFDLKGHFSPNHELLVKLRLDGIITLNYDDGLSSAYVRAHQVMPRVIRADDRYELNRWTHGSFPMEERVPLIHWHGSFSAPDKIVLTADDYNKFYSKVENKSFVEDLWRSRSLLVVGFSFKDPFLNRIAETVLRPLECDNRHFAIIGQRAPEGVSSILRRQLARKLRLTPIFYPVVETEDGHEDHSALTEILAMLIDKSRQSAETGRAELILKQDVDASGRKAAETDLDKARRDFESSLFVSKSGALVYVEPRLYAPGELGTDNDLTPPTALDLSNLVLGHSSYVVSAPSEYGGTTLARKIVMEVLARQGMACVRSAPELPSYRAKLTLERFFEAESACSGKLLILDDVDTARDERLIKEIIGLNAFARIILIVKDRGVTVAEIKSGEATVEFLPLQLQQLSRENIRSVATILYDSYDADMVSAAVDKTYGDLLELCIPLTSSNIIMYLSVLYKEGRFVPLNRLHIMDQYIRDLLYKPSDAFRDTFNADHKIDVLSSFVFQLYEDKAVSFTRGDWDLFANSEIKRAISSFDKDGLFADLISGRFIVRRGDIFHFKYKLFYAFFLGQHLSQRPDVIRAFIDDDKHTKIDGLVETLAGLSKNNEYLLNNLAVKLENSLCDFHNQYCAAEFDPYAEIVWAIKHDEQDRVWAPIAERLAAGPASDSEVDKLKRSISAENRTEDQLVIIRDFTEIERSASFNQKLLIAALRESRNVDGPVKVRCIKAILSAYKVVMQIGFMFAPIIASRKYFMWNNVAFVNNLNYSDDDKSDELRQTRLVMGAIPPAVCDRSANEIGSKRLGDLFAHLAEHGDLDSFQRLVTFSALTRAKPEGWERVAKESLVQTDRQALYLSYMLSALMAQFHEEVNTVAERAAIKRLVGTIQAKRQLKKDSPTPKMINNLVKFLDSRRYFSDKPS